MGTMVCVNHGYLPDEVVAAAEAEMGVGARALYFYLWTRPPGWEVRRTDMGRRFGGGERALRRAITELKAKGYLMTQDLRVGNRVRRRKMHFRPKGDADQIPKSVEIEEPLAVTIGQTLPDPDYGLCHHGNAPRKCFECRVELKEHQEHRR